MPGLEPGGFHGLDGPDGIPDCGVKWNKQEPVQRLSGTRLSGYSAVQKTDRTYDGAKKQSQDNPVLHWLPGLVDIQGIKGRNGPQDNGGQGQFADVKTIE